MLDIKTPVRQYLMDNSVVNEVATIADDDSFLKNHVLDSAGFIDLVVFIEKTFNIVIEDDEIDKLADNFDSLTKVEIFVTRKLELCS